MTPLLQAADITKTFPGVRALDGVSFEARAGEVHALCGENGAGKSTLIKVLSGLHPVGSYGGELLWEGAKLEMRSPGDAGTHGIAVIYQELAIVPEMTVAENIFLGREPVRGGLVDALAMNDAARQILARFNLNVAPETRAGDLGVGVQQLVEIARALSKNARLLILDEPTAALAEAEVQTLLSLVRDLRQQGLACIYISHRLDEIFAISDRITVLRDGRSVFSAPTAETNEDELIRNMVGREVTELYPPPAAEPGDVRFAVKSLDVEYEGKLRLRDISFEVRAGEVLGIGGLMGAGRTELLMHLAGAWGKRVGGEVVLDGAALPAGSVEKTLSAGLALVSEDRKKYGLILDESVGFNLSLAALPMLSPRLGWLDRTREWSENSALRQSLRIKTASLDTAAGTLSGGNQQKIVLGKALMTSPKVILLDEPTRGVDIGAKAEIYGVIRELTKQGLAVVLVSSELPELMGLSDRILMLHEGEVGGVFTRAEATPERLLAAAMGTGVANGTAF